MILQRDPGVQLKRRDQTGEQRGPTYKITQPDMFVRSVGAVAVNAEAVQHGYIQRRGEVAIRCATHRAFAQFETSCAASSFA